MPCCTGTCPSGRWRSGSLRSWTPQHSRSATRTAYQVGRRVPGRLEREEGARGGRFALCFKPQHVKSGFLVRVPCELFPTGQGRPRQGVEKERSCRAAGSAVSGPAWARVEVQWPSPCPLPSLPLSHALPLVQLWSSTLPRQATSWQRAWGIPRLAPTSTALRHEQEGGME